MKPCFKWAGNKYRLIDKVKSILPKSVRLIEPFLGAGAVFLNTKYPSYVLADSNFELINFYKHLQKEKQSFILYCSRFFGNDKNTKREYKKNKDLFNTTDDLRLKAALFLYLNKHCFNGLMRVNGRGIFNVSFGQNKTPYFPLKEMLFFSNKLIKATIHNDNFIVTMGKARCGDIVYCDPPYVSLSKTPVFKEYGSSLFGLKEQLSLLSMTEKLISKGIVVIISNHDTEFTNYLYKSSILAKFDVQRFISSNGKNRFQVKELIAVFP